ncbi:MAG: hypothetical protein ACTSPS_20380 [Promethearchaeota archaeon]
MKLENWKQKAYFFAILGCILYVILVVLAMVFYPGGTPTNPNTRGYTFWENFLSDLGRTKAHSGEDNMASMILYNMAVIIWGVSLIPFFLALRLLFTEGKIEKRLSTIGSCLGVIAAIGLIGIGLAPSDILGGPHIISVYVAYIALLHLGIIYSITFFKSEKLPVKYAIVCLIWTLIFMNTITLGIVGQKIGRFSTIICFAYLGYGALKLEKS